jgi:hypothetical protein
VNDITALKKQWFVDDDFLKTHLQPLVLKANSHCKITGQGEVIILTPTLSAKEQIMLTLAARAIASQIEPQIRAEVSVKEIGQYTHIPADQIRARCKDAVNDKFASTSNRGVFRALPQKIEPFLDSISASNRVKTAAQ